MGKPYKNRALRGATTIAQTPVPASTDAYPSVINPEDCIVRCPERSYDFWHYGKGTKARPGANLQIGAENPRLSSPSISFRRRPIDVRKRRVIQEGLTG
jgi:hypothetical protein